MVVCIVLVILAIYGSLVRVLEMLPTLRRLPMADQCREWLGLMLIMALCFSVIGLYAQFNQPPLAIIAMGGTLFYVYTARRQFPIF